MGGVPHGALWSQHFGVSHFKAIHSILKLPELGVWFKCCAVQVHTLKVALVEADKGFCCMEFINEETLI